MQRPTPAVAVLLLAPLLAACSGAPRQATSTAHLPLTGAPPPSAVATALTTAAAPRRTVIVALTSPVQRGARATLSAVTVPRALCRATVTYGERGTAPTAVATRTASSAGAATWTWTVPTRVPAGSWPVTVACTPGGDATTLLSVR